MSSKGDYSLVLIVVFQGVGRSVEGLDNKS